MIENTDNRATREDALQHLSDLYKSIYGVRPSIGNYSTLSDEELWMEIQNLQRNAEEDDNHNAEIENHSIANFEALIQKTIQTGAGDRATALRWLYDGSDADYGGEELLHKHGISGYTPEGNALKKEIDAAISIQEQTNKTKQRLFENFEKVNKIKLQ